jgi:hypothetical protein
VAGSGAYAPSSTVGTYAHSLVGFPATSVPSFCCLPSVSDISGDRQIGLDLLGSINVTDSLISSLRFLNSLAAIVSRPRTPQRNAVAMHFNYYIILRMSNAFQPTKRETHTLSAAHCPRPPPQQSNPPKKREGNNQDGRQLHRLRWGGIQEATQPDARHR